MLTSRGDTVDSLKNQLNHSDNEFNELKPKLRKYE